MIKIRQITERYRRRWRQRQALLKLIERIRQDLDK